MIVGKGVYFAQVQMGVEAELFQLDTPEISDKLLGKNLRIQTQKQTCTSFKREPLCYPACSSPRIQMPAQIKKKKILSGT